LGLLSGKLKDQSRKPFLAESRKTKAESLFKQKAERPKQKAFLSREQKDQSRKPF
jgi:hypothetical protein